MEKKNSSNCCNIFYTIKKLLYAWLGFEIMFPLEMIIYSCAWQIFNFKTIRYKNIMKFLFYKKKFEI